MIPDNALATARQINSHYMCPADILYVSECSVWGERGYEMAVKALGSVTAVLWSPGMPKPNLDDWCGDWIISFKSDLILNKEILERAKKGAINFHPSPPKYRGIGGYWWAIENRDEAFGVTCHHMDERIDHGAIIKANSFAISPEETVESLKEKAAVHSLSLLKNTLDDIVSGRPLQACGAEWGKRLYTREALELAQKVEPAMKALQEVISDELPSRSHNKNSVSRDWRVA